MSEAILSERLLQEFARWDLPHLAAPYGISLSLAENTVFGLELPYDALGGLGFERLCFHLLLAQGKSPRFFGDRGQAQFGIDLIVGDGFACEVYQCKNVAVYDARALQRDLAKFEREWLNDRPGLPRPAAFTICCSDALHGRDDWEKVKRAFGERTGVRVEAWTRETLDAWLKSAPDIVADLFGDAVAERFCQRDHWNDGRFRPLLAGNGDKDVERFLTLGAEGRLARNPDVEKKFHDILADGRRILLEGLSGAGKTIAALDFGAATGRRVFFVRVDEDIDEQSLFLGVKERCARETLFVIDDCQRNWPVVERADRRWRQALAGTDYKLVFTAQTAPGEGESYGIGTVDLLEELRADGEALTLAPGTSEYRAVLAKADPSIPSLSNAELDRLRAMTGGSLAVLDLLAATGGGALTAAGSIESNASTILNHWFKTRSPTAPHLLAFAAVAQFDLTIPAQAAWPEPEASTYPLAIRRLVHRIGDHERDVAPSWRFSHPTAGEALFRALVRVGLAGDWQACAADHITEHLRRAADEPQRFTRDIQLFLSNRLRLSDDSNLKNAVLARPEFQRAAEQLLRTGPLRDLSLVTFLARSQGDAAPYASWLAERLTGVLDGTTTPSSGDLAIFGSALRALGLASPARRLGLETSSRPDALSRLIGAHGALPGLFKTIQNATPDFAAGLIAAFEPDRVAALIDNTIASEDSIGALDLILRDLATRPMPDGDGRSQLQALQSLIGGALMLRLICERGTLLELVRIAQHTTPEFAAGLIAALDAEAVAILIDKTIASERSIGTLGLSLRDLAARPMPDGDDRTQLQALQSLIGGAPLLRLICARGSLLELLTIAKQTTPDFAAGLIAALDADTVAVLIDRAIAREHSIGTLGLVLRELAARPMPDGRSQLEAVQSLIGGVSMLRLIRARGTLLGLFKILQYTTPDFAADLIAALEPEIVASLIDQTIAAEGSIATLHLTLWDLADRPMPSGAARHQLEALQSLIGGAPMLRLICARGTLFELFMILKHATPDFAAGLIAALNPDTVAALIDKTIASGRSIMTLELALRELSGRPMPSGDGRSQLEALQTLVGGAPMLRLICAQGTLLTLFGILRRTTPDFAAGLIAALEPDMVAALVDKTIATKQSIGPLRFALRYMRTNLPQSLTRFEALLQPAGFWRLVEEAGDLNDLAYILEAISPGFSAQVTAPTVAPDLGRWRALLRHGKFYAIARFGRDSLGRFSAQTIASLVEAVDLEAASLADSAPWSDLSPGLSCCGEITNRPLGDLLIAAAESRLERVDLDDIEFETLPEAASCLIALWERRPTFRGEIGRRLWRLLPSEHTWPNDHQRLVGGRFLFRIAAAPQVSDQDARRLLAAFAPAPASLKLNKCGAHTLFLFLWNLHAFWTARGRPGAQEFTQLWRKPTWDRVFDRLDSLADRARSQEEKLNVFALAGALSYISRTLDNRLRTLLKARFKSVNGLIEANDAQTFISGALASLGLCLVRPEHEVLSRYRVARLIAKATEYAERGPGVEALCRYLKHR